MNRIREIREATGMTQRQVADAIPLSLPNYNRLENGHTKLTTERMDQLAEIFGCDPLDLITGHHPTRTVQVRAYVEAGAWVESWEWEEEDWYEVAVPDDPVFHGFSLYGAETRGPSMNRRYPEGTVLIFTDAIEAEEDVQVGKRYIVERERADGMREATVKTLIADDQGKLWLMPESSDPRHQQPIEIGGDEGDTVRLLGRVRYSVQRED